MEKKKQPTNTKNYNQLVDSIIFTLEKARQKAFSQVNTILVETYWKIGEYIVEFEQKGNIKSEYGSNLIDYLAKDLKQKYGRGFSRSNLYLFRQFFIKSGIFTNKTSSFLLTI